MRTLLAWILALVSFPLTNAIVFVLMVPFDRVESALQQGGKSAEEWRALGVLCPGERVAWLSFVFGVIRTAISKTVAVLVAAHIFHLFGHAMPLLLVLLVAALAVLRDVARIIRFLGNSGVWTECGYLLGDLVGMTIGAVLALRYIV